MIGFRIVNCTDKLNAPIPWEKSSVLRCFFYKYNDSANIRQDCLPLFDQRPLPVLSPSAASRPTWHARKHSYRPPKWIFGKVAGCGLHIPPIQRTDSEESREKTTKVERKPLSLPNSTGQGQLLEGEEKSYQQ